MTPQLVCSRVNDSVFVDFFTVYCFLPDAATRSAVAAHSTDTVARHDLHLGHHTVSGEFAQNFRQIDKTASNHL